MFSVCSILRKSVSVLAYIASNRGFMTLQFSSFYTRLLLVILYSVVSLKSLFVVTGGKETGSEV